MNIIQIVTDVEVTIANCFPEVGEILPEAEGRGPYFPEGKQFPIVTDNASLYFCYTSSRNACRQCTLYNTMQKLKRIILRSVGQYVIQRFH